MLSFLTSAVRGLRDRLHAARDPCGFARSLGVRLGSNVRFYGLRRNTFGSEPWLIRIGSNVYITADVQFVTHDGGTLILRKDHPTLEWTAPIEIGDDVYIGIRSIILPGVSIGNRCIIGAGSIVTRSIPDGCVYAGVPASFICTTDAYLERMKEKSLGFGHMPAAQKAEAIREYYKEWLSKDT